MADVGIDHNMISPRADNLVEYGLSGRYMIKYVDIIKIHIYLKFVLKRENFSLNRQCLTFF